MPEERLPHAFGFCQFGMIPMFHENEVTKEMLQMVKCRSEELFVSYSIHCDMGSI
jgi:hypothetical protein